MKMETLLANLQNVQVYVNRLFCKGYIIFTAMIVKQIDCGGLPVHGVCIPVITVTIDIFSNKRKLVLSPRDISLNPETTIY